MPTQGDRPYLGCNFLVDLGDGAHPRTGGTGFAEVIFPSFRSASARTRRAAATKLPGEGARRLVLRRGASGALDLYLWWNQARIGKAPKRRTVTVRLLGEDHAQVVTTWRFSNVRPVSLSFTPLNAMEASVLMETIELEFDGVEML